VAAAYRSSSLDGRTAEFTDNYVRPYESTSSGFTTTGVAHLAAVNLVSTQSLALRINKAF